jgi:hypothetical protein
MPLDVRHSKNRVFLKDMIWSRIQGCLDRILSKGEGHPDQIGCTSYTDLFFGMFQTAKGAFLFTSTKCSESFGGESMQERGSQVGFLGEKCASLNTWGFGFLRY